MGTSSIDESIRAHVSRNSSLSRGSGVRAHARLLRLPPGRRPGDGARGHHEEDVLAPVSARMEEGAEPPRCPWVATCGGARDRRSSPTRVASRRDAAGSSLQPIVGCSARLATEHRRGAPQFDRPPPTTSRRSTRPLRSGCRARDRDQLPALSDRTRSTGPHVASISYPYPSGRTDRSGRPPCDREFVPLLGCNPRHGLWRARRNRCRAIIARPSDQGKRAPPRRSGPRDGLIRARRLHVGAAVGVGGLDQAVIAHYASRAARFAKLSPQPRRPGPRQGRRPGRASRAPPDQEC
jgi:hypothetical protein